MAAAGISDGKEEDIKKLLESLNDKKGETRKSIDQLKSDPTLMKPFIDQVESIKNEPYSSADVSMSKTSSAGMARPNHQDLQDLFRESPRSSVYTSSTMISGGFGGLVIGLVVIGIAILAVVLLLFFIF